MFGVSLSKDVLHVEPGNAATLVVSVSNRSDVADRYEIEIEGLDAEWVAIPVASFTLGPGEEKQQKALIKPPRAAESKAGSYPFLVKVRSLETGHAEEAQGVLEVEPFSLVSIEVEPRRETASALSKQAPYTVTAINLGNEELNLQLFADDPEDGCTYQFAQERVSLAPGQQKQVRLTVQPSHFPFLGTPRLFGFTVSARGVDNPHVSSNAQAQIERKATVSPAVLAVALILLLFGFFWFMNRPQDPYIKAFHASKYEVLSGETIKLFWEAAHATRVEIELSDGRVITGGPSGEVEVQVDATVKFNIVALNDSGRKSAPFDEIEVIAKIPEQEPLPVIEAMTVSPAKTTPGTTVTVTYKVQNADRIILQPFNYTLPINFETFQFTASGEGRIELTLTAFNKSGQAAQKTATLTVEVPSKAQITMFRASLLGDPIGDREIEPDTPITLEWSVAGAARAMIDPAVPDFDVERGSATVFLRRTTTFTLTVYDSDNRPVSQKITIKIKQPVGVAPGDGGSLSG